MTDIRGAEPFNTDKLLMSLCNGETDTQYWFINVETGELKEDTTHGQAASKLPYPIERFQGSCYYPKSTSWTWGGDEKRITDTLLNCGRNSDLTQQIQESGSTTSTTTNSVTGSVGINWTAIKDVLSVSAGAEYTHTWSYAKAKGWSKSTSMTVHPRTVGWLGLRPDMRTVRSNPVFHVTKYAWGKSGGGQVSVDSWRGRGYSYINSYGAYYDAVGNVINSDGTPRGIIVAHDRAVNSADRC
ncbi:hypothetical protein ACWCQQ_41625 [Streptomyces sp. NPDC002143]